ncbi:hypothetical protein [Streptomyces sp. NPDC058371]|uniref:hypothetical protein n=1 Tax=Streptomyces sp. NPDC058371 TaxID=3346463 RepID=UPI00365C457C
MIDAQTVKPGTPVVLATGLPIAGPPPTRTATLSSTPPEPPYGLVDEAGAVVCGTRTCQGMDEWHTENADAARINLRNSAN